MKKKLIFSIIIIGTYLLFYYGIRQLPRPDDFWMRFSLFNALPMVFILGVTYLLHRGKVPSLEALGLNKPLTSAIKVAFIMTLPMMIGYGILSNFEFTITLSSFFLGCLWAAFSEEIVYRAFLFGQLFRFGKWPFLIAGMLNALIFGFGHLYQAGGDINTAILIFLTTAMGGLWFAWLYIEWDNNLWIPVGLHFFMNLWWTLFDVGDNAAGGLSANIFRIATIVISIIWTIRMARKRGFFNISKHNLLFTPKSIQP